jgi:CheY-specific phosphatase CheX
MSHTGFHHPPALCHGPQETFSCSSLFLKLPMIIQDGNISVKGISKKVISGQRLAISRQLSAAGKTGE